MVATRRGVRVYSESKTEPEPASNVQATPSTGRRTRGTTAQQEEGPATHNALPESLKSPPPTLSSRRRCTRASRLHSPEQSCTPASSVHGGDTSDPESCCSDAHPPPTRQTRGRRSTRKPHPVSQEEDEEEDVSEVESCCSAVSASKVGQSGRRKSTRNKASVEAFIDFEAESCSSTVSDSQRVTRSQRKTTRTRSALASAKKPAEDSELSDADSCTSVASGTEASQSYVRRSTRTRRRTGPIPIHLDDTSDGSSSPARHTRSAASRGKAAIAAVDLSEPQSCESEGFESGPTYSARTRRGGRPLAASSDSEPPEVRSPTGSTTRSRGTTPSSSRAGSGGNRSSRRGAQDPKVSLKDLSIVLEKAAAEQVEEEEATSDNSRLESTVIAGDADATLLDEDKDESQTTQEKEGMDTVNSESVDTIHVEEGVNVVPEEEDNDSIVAPSVSEVKSQEDKKDEDCVDVMAVDTISVEKKGVLVIPEEGEDSIVAPSVPEKDADRTPVEDEAKSQEDKEDEDCVDAMAVDTISVEKKGVLVIPEEEKEVDAIVAPLVSAEEVVVVEPAVSVSPQQEEPSADNNVSDMETKQETVGSSEAAEPCQPITETEREDTSETAAETEKNDEASEVAEPDTQSPPPTPAATEDAVVETQPGEEEKEEEEEDSMEVESSEDAQQVVDSPEVQVEPMIRVTSSQQQQQQRITVEPPGPSQQQQPPPVEDVAVGNRKAVCLLESSEDEEESDEEEEEDEMEDEEEDGAGPSSRPEAAAASSSSVGGLFMIDTRPGQQADQDYYKEKKTTEEEEEEEESQEKAGGQEEGEEDEEFVDEEGDDDADEDADVLFASKNPHLKEMSSRIDPGLRVKELGGLYINFYGSKSKPVFSAPRKLNEKKIQDEVMKKSVMGPDFLKKDAVPPYSESKEALKTKRRAEREKSTGDSWFNMKAPELTQELKGDLQVLKMRGSMDPKRFYKKNDRDGFPKYFQVATVVDNPVDFYHSRVPKKARKRTMVEELLSDAEFRQKNKKKYQQIVTEKAAQGSGRRFNRKKKFQKK